MPKIVANEMVYQAAMRMVMTKGYTNATTKQIADAANISEVTLFRKYGSKAELVKRAIVAIAEKTDFSTLIQYTGDIHADLSRIIETYQQTVAENGQFFHTLLLEIPRHPELEDVLDTPLGIMSQIGQLLARYQGEGILQQEHPMHAVASLLGPLIITNLMRNTRADIPMPATDIQHHIFHFLNGRLK